MSLDYLALKAELLAGHPSTGAYNADDQLAADELNALNRPVPVPAIAILEYCLTETYRENSGSDLQATNLYGRVSMVAGSQPGADPFGVADQITVGQVAAAKTVLRLLEDDGLALSLAIGDIDSALTKCQGSNCFSPAQKNAIVGLAENKQSRALELDLGRTKINAGHVAHARSI
ncbi:MAG: hypothetical protein ACR2Q3_01555 [Woeseiaceae bacterium]